MKKINKEKFEKVNRIMKSISLHKIKGGKQKAGGPGGVIVVEDDIM